MWRIGIIDLPTRPCEGSGASPIVYPTPEKPWPNPPKNTHTIEPNQTQPRDGSSAGQKFHADNSKEPNRTE